MQTLHKCQYGNSINAYFFSCQALRITTLLSRKLLKLGIKLDIRFDLCIWFYSTTFYFQSLILIH